MGEVLFSYFSTAQVVFINFTEVRLHIGAHLRPLEGPQTNENVFLQFSIHIKYIIVIDNYFWLIICFCACNIKVVSKKSQRLPAAVHMLLVLV